MIEVFESGLSAINKPNGRTGMLYESVVYGVRNLSRHLEQVNDHDDIKSVHGPFVDQCPNLSIMKRGPIAKDAHQLLAVGHDVSGSIHRKVTGACWLGERPGSGDGDRR